MGLSVWLFPAISLCLDPSPKVAGRWDVRRSGDDVAIELIPVIRLANSARTPTSSQIDGLLVEQEWICLVGSDEICLKSVPHLFTHLMVDAARAHYDRLL